MILFTTCRCYRELASPTTGAATSSSPTKPHQSTVPPTSSGNSSSSTAPPCKGEFDPLVETVKAARSSSSIITSLLTSPHPQQQPLCPPLPPQSAAAGGEVEAGVTAAHECLTLSARASMAMDMASSTSFGQAVREALVRSPSRELRVNARSMLASLSRVDLEIAAEVEAYGGQGGERGGFISQTTVMVRVDGMGWVGLAGWIGIVCSGADGQTDVAVDARRECSAVLCRLL